MKSKLTSRKFWVALIPIFVGIFMMLGFSEDVATVIAGALITVCCAVGYMFAEAKVDASNLRAVVAAILEILDAISKEEVVTPETKEAAAQIKESIGKV